MNGTLFGRTLASYRTRWLLIGLAIFAWGVLMPVIYNAFSDAVRDLANSGAIPEEMLNIGSGSMFTLPGVLTVGFQHPLAIALLAVFAVGATAAAIAGERQRGTLEVILARPLTRTAVYLTVLVAVLLVLASLLGLFLAGFASGATSQGIVDELAAEHLPLTFLNGLLLWAAFATFGMAASVSFDRAGPALGLTLGYLLANYFLEILGSLWPDVEWTQEYSLFHHFQPTEILAGALDPADLLILGVAVAVPIVYALVVFPRRDLAAPA